MTAADAQWAWRLADHCISTMRDMAARHVADNEVEANVNKILNAIRDAGAEGITGRELNNAIRSIHAKERNAILFDLVNDGAIMAKKIPPTTRGGRPGFRYLTGEL